MSTVSQHEILIQHAWSRSVTSKTLYDVSRYIKQGMMQQLLTGRARLIDTVRKQMGKD